MQSEGKLAAGVPRRYPSATGAYSIIVKCGLLNPKTLTMYYQPPGAVIPKP